MSVMSFLAAYALFFVLASTIAIALQNRKPGAMGLFVALHFLLTGVVISHFAFGWF